MADFSTVQGVRAEFARQDAEIQAMRAQSEATDRQWRRWAPWVAVICTSGVAACSYLVFSAVFRSML